MAWLGKVRYLIEIYSKQSDGSYLGTPSISITDALALDSDKSISTTSDSFTFRVKNVVKPDGTYTYQDKIFPDDRALLYLTTQEDITDGNKSSYQKFDGLVVQTSYEVSTTGRVIVISCLNRFEKLLNFLHPSIYEGKVVADASGNPEEGIIPNLIGQVNDGQRGYDNSVNQISWASGNSVTTTIINYYRSYRPVHEMIQELSRKSQNGEFNAYYFINNDNEFVWKEKNNDTDTLILEEGVDYDRVKIQEKIWDVINAMITDCGTDPSGRNVHAMYYNEASAAKYGLKWANTIETEAEIAETIKKEQRKVTGWVDNADANKQDFPENYPLTLSFDERRGDGVRGTTAAQATNDTTFNSLLRTEIRWSGIDWMKDVLDYSGVVRPKVDITLSGSHWEMGAGRTGTSAENCLDSNGNPILQGELVTFKCTSRGGSFVDGLRLRVISVNHEFGRNGWLVTMRIESDPEDFNPEYPL